jgi:hypothetical protein
MRGVYGLVLGLFVFTGCGGSSSTAPTNTGGSNTPTAPTTPTTLTSPQTSTSGVFTFNFPVGTLITDTDLIKNSIVSQAAVFQTAFGRTVTQATTINGSTTDPGCANAGSSAFTGIRTMTICVGNSGWTVHNSLNRQKIVMHETFHLLQFEMQWLGHPNPDAASAHWIDEGTAEFVGWAGAAGLGLVTPAAARACMVAQANAQVPPTATLGAMETGAGFGIPGAYQLSMLGIDSLLASPGISALMTYGTAIGKGTAWPTAFQSAFGISKDTFYANFPAYRTSLGAGSDTCGV